MGHQALAPFNGLVADALGVDRTVPRGVAEIRCGYKKVQGGYSVDRFYYTGHEADRAKKTPTERRRGS